MSPTEFITRQSLIDIVSESPDAIVLLGGGVPCQEVSLLKSNRQGCTSGESALRDDFGRVAADLQELVGDRLVAVMECTEMDSQDQKLYDHVFGSTPWLLCARHFTPVTRPPAWPEGTIIDTPGSEFLEPKRPRQGVDK